MVRDFTFMILNTVELGFSERFDQQITVTKSWVVTCILSSNNWFIIPKKCHYLFLNSWSLNQGFTALQ